MLVGLKGNDIKWLIVVSRVKNECQNDDVVIVAELSKWLCLVRLMAIKYEKMILSYLWFCLMDLKMANPVKHSIVVGSASLGNCICIVIIIASLCILAFLVHYPGRTRKRTNNGSTNTDSFDNHQKQWFCRARSEEFVFWISTQDPIVSSHFNYKSHLIHIPKVTQFIVV
jgi:hypothetical protein